MEDFCRTNGRFRFRRQKILIFSGWAKSLSKAEPYLPGEMRDQPAIVDAGQTQELSACWSAAKLAGS
jgi:hypothetical protein